MDQKIETYEMNGDSEFGWGDSEEEYIDINKLHQDSSGKYFDESGREVGFDDNGFPYYVDELVEDEVDSEDITDIIDNSEMYNNEDDSDIDEELGSVNEEESDSTDSIEPIDGEEETIEPLDDDDDINCITGNDFLDENGNLSVMNQGDSKDTFEIKVLTYKNIALSKRVRNGKNVDDLLASIKSTGLLSPIIVAPLKTEGVYVLIDGYRRVLACAKAGITEIPAIINNRIKTTEIPIVEAMYNHKKPYTMEDIVKYIEYLEKEKGITNTSLIEFLMELDSGDYNKLKDILTDNDEDIVTKLMNGQLTIAQAFKQLEKRRAKESKEEKDLKQVSKVYDNTEESGVEEIKDAGETGDEESALTDEQLESLTSDPTQLDKDVASESLEDMIDEGNNMKGFEAHKQKVGEREYIDPALRKAVLERDKATCQCCKLGGQRFLDILDYHHILPVFLGGKDTIDNGIMLCVACHRLVHLYSTGDLYIDKELLEDEYSNLTDEGKAKYQNDEQIFKAEKERFKRVVYMGNKIRKGMEYKGINREQYKKEHPNTGIGRRKPGKNAQQDKA